MAIHSVLVFAETKAIMQNLWAKFQMGWQWRWGSQLFFIFFYFMFLILLRRREGKELSLVFFLTALTSNEWYIRRNPEGTVLVMVVIQKALEGSYFNGVHPNCADLVKGMWCIRRGHLNLLTKFKVFQKQQNKIIPMNVWPTAGGNFGYCPSILKK